MARLPDCPNFRRKRCNCAEPNIRLIGEGGDHWTFECGGDQKLIWVVSKPTEVAASKFRVEEERLRQEAIRRRQRESRPKWFT